MTEYQIQGSTLRCAHTGRELKAGERYFSVLRIDGGKFIRSDYSKDAWQGPPPGAFSYWQGKVPAGQKPRRPPIDGRQNITGRSIREVNGVVREAGFGPYQPCRSTRLGDFRRQIFKSFVEE